MKNLFSEYGLAILTAVCAIFAIIISFGVFMPGSSFSNIIDIIMKGCI